jgi:mRNA interferase MazF
VTPKPGEIYLVDLGLAAKVRPAVVVSRHDLDSPRALALLVPLTTENRGSDYEVSLGKLRFLNKESWANVQGLMSFGHERLIRPLGTVASSQLAQIKSALSFALGLSV